MIYGVEIWGWEGKKELEKIMLDCQMGFQDRFLYAKIYNIKRTRVREIKDQGRFKNKRFRRKNKGKERG